jgi:hypothetical protein
MGENRYRKLTKCRLIDKLRIPDPFKVLAGFRQSMVMKEELWKPAPYIYKRDIKGKCKIS